MSDVETAAPEAAESVSAPEIGTEIDTPVSISEDPQTPSEEKPRSMDDTLKDAWRKSQKAPRERDANGRFQSLEGAEAAAPDEISDQEPQAASPPAAPEVDVPNSWTAEAKAMWAKVPPELRPYLAQRETEAHKTISRQGQELKAIEQYRPLLERSNATFSKYGVDTIEGFEQLLNANDYLERDAASAIRDLANAYGVDLRQLVGAPAAPGSSDPQIAQLHHTVAQLQRQLHESNNRWEQRATQESEREVQAIQAQVVAFAKDKPFWADVEDDVEAQIHALKFKHPDMSPTDLLTKAYEKALRTNDEVWGRHQAAEKAKEEKRRQEEAAKRAADAKKAQPLGVKSSTANTSAPKTMDDTLKAIAKRRFQS